MGCRKMPSHLRKANFVQLSKQSVCVPNCKKLSPGLKVVSERLNLFFYDLILRRKNGADRET